VLKWQPDGEYMKTAISLLQNPVRGQSLLAFSPTKSRHSFTANIFKAITKNVSRGEQCQLIKALLEADHLHGTEISPTSPGWMRKWRAACNKDQWKDAKRQLVSENLISHEVGKIVLNCALAVIAERLLRSYMEKLEKFRAQFLCLGISDSGDAETWRRCYIEILKDVGQSGLDLSLSLYKYSVRVLLWNEETAGFNYAEQRMALESLSLKQHKYVRLINKYIGINLHEVDDVVDNVVPLETGT
jgi:transcriptional regulator CtsR